MNLRSGWVSGDGCDAGSAYRRTCARAHTHTHTRAYARIRTTRHTRHPWLGWRGRGTGESMVSTRKNVAPCPWGLPTTGVSRAWSPQLGESRLALQADAGARIWVRGLPNTPPMGKARRLPNAGERLPLVATESPPSRVLQFCHGENGPAKTCAIPRDGPRRCRPPFHFSIDPPPRGI